MHYVLLCLRGSNNNCLPFTIAIGVFNGYAFTSNSMAMPIDLIGIAIELLVIVALTVESSHNYVVFIGCLKWSCAELIVQRTKNLARERGEKYTRGATVSCRCLFSTCGPCCYQS